MKKYYSTTKPYFKRKRLRLGFRLFKAILRLFFPKNEVIYRCEKPSDDEPMFMVSNHTKIYAPLAALLCPKKKIRVWSNYYFLYFKEIGNHLFNKVLIDRKPKWLLYPLGTLLIPLIVWIFRSIEPIPVYHKTKKVQITFDKSIETMEEGVDQMIFPERTENPVNKYIYEFNTGFPYVAKQYYEQTGKRMKFYPVYTCQSLRKIFIGEPITYDPEIPMNTQKHIICKYLENAIFELAESLPEHKITFYG